MDEKDVLDYLKSRRQQARRTFGTVICIALMVLYVALMVMGYDGVLVSAIAIGAFGAGVGINFDHSGWGQITRKDLLDIIERQIQKDPKAIELVARHQSRQ